MTEWNFKNDIDKYNVAKKINPAEKNPVGRSLPLPHPPNKNEMVVHLLVLRMVASSTISLETQLVLAEADSEQQLLIKKTNC